MLKSGSSALLLRLEAYESQVDKNLWSSWEKRNKKNQ